METASTTITTTIFTDACFLIRLLSRKGDAAWLLVNTLERSVRGHCEDKGRHKLDEVVGNHIAKAQHVTVVVVAVVATAQ